MSSRSVASIKIVSILYTLFLSVSALAVSPTASSINGAVVNASSPSLVDSNLNTWSISGGAEAQYIPKGSTTAKAAGYNSGTILVLYYNGAIYIENKSFAWWSWNYTTSSWVARGSLGDPRVPSRVGAMTPNPLTSIVDGSHDVWVTKAGSVYKNGVKDPVSANVTSLLYFGGQVLQVNSSMSWYYYNGSTWVARGSLGDPRVPSAANSETPQNPYVVDGQKNVWAVSSNSIFQNGQSIASHGTPTVQYTGAYVYEIDSDGSKYIWSGTGWVLMSTSPPSGSTPATPAGPAIPSAVSALGFTKASFYDDFTNMSSTIDLNDTLKSGYHWYKKCPWNNNVSVSSKFSSVKVGTKSVLRIDGTGGGGGLFSLTSDSTGATAVGTTVPPTGAYMEASIAMGYPENMGEGVPTFYSTNSVHALNKPVPWAGEPDTSYWHYLEYDIMEFFNGDNYDTRHTLIDWFGKWGEITPICARTSLCAALISQYNGTHTKGSFDSTEAKPVFHKFGTLWVPSVKNASTGKYGQGYVQWYLDGKPVLNRINYTGPPPSTAAVPAVPWKYSILDQFPQMLVIGTASNAFMYVNYVGVWQK